MVIARSAGSLCLPARFLLVLAANPCPCGKYSPFSDGCGCTPTMVRRYQARLSGPLLDRVDLRVQVEPVGREELLGRGEGVETTREIAARVHQARERAQHRFAGLPWHTNSEVPGHELRSRWTPDLGALDEVERELERGRLTARGLDRVLRVAWTVADLAGRARPGVEEVRTALELRTEVHRGARVSEVVR